MGCGASSVTAVPHRQDSLDGDESTESVSIEAPLEGVPSQNKSKGQDPGSALVHNEVMVEGDDPRYYRETVPNDLSILFASVCAAVDQMRPNGTLVPLKPNSTLPFKQTIYLSIYVLQIKLM